MIERYFTSLRLPLTREELDRLPRHPAYHPEFRAGSAWLLPQPRFVAAVLALDRAADPSARGIFPVVTVRRLERADWLGLPPLFAFAFERVPPFCCLSPSERRRAARCCLRHTRKGRDGTLIEPACYVAERVQDAKPTLCGAALVVRQIVLPHQPRLIWMMVHPWLVRQGIGGTLLDRVATTLREQGERALHSSILVGNGPALLWHWRQGFQIRVDRATVPVPGQPC